MKVLQIGKAGYNLDNLKKTTKEKFEKTYGANPNWESHWSQIEKAIKPEKKKSTDEESAE